MILRHIILLLTLFIFFLITSNNVLGATCSEPDIFIDANSDRFHVNGKIDINLTVSQDPPPSVGCFCPGTVNQCRLRWLQFDYRDGLFWNINPTTQNDLNCSGANCYVNEPYGEDVEHSRSITCAGQRTFFMAGRIAEYSAISSFLKIECYPQGEPGFAISACTPPISGNFDLNSFCHYIDVNILVDQNFNIQGNGWSDQENSDINFTDPTVIHKIRIQDGGKIDQNNVKIFIGKNTTIIEEKNMIILFLFFTSFLLIILHNYLTYKPNDSSFHPTA